MKKSSFLFVAILSFFSFSCSSYDYDLKKMGEAVKSHFRYRDMENGTKTTIEYLKALSYEKLPEEKRENPDDYYLCKVHIKGTWAYDNSFRIFNMNDTLNCYFSKSKTFVRMGDKKQ